FYASVPYRDLHSFPTRRSSDLLGFMPAGIRACGYQARSIPPIHPYFGNTCALSSGAAGSLRARSSTGCCALVLLWSSGSYFCFRSEEHTSELQSRENLVCRLLL